MVENYEQIGLEVKHSLIYLSFSKDDVWMEFPKKGEIKWHGQHVD